MKLLEYQFQLSVIIAGIIVLVIQQNKLVCGDDDYDDEYDEYGEKKTTKKPVTTPSTTTSSTTPQPRWTFNGKGWVPPPPAGWGEPGFFSEEDSSTTIPTNTESHDHSEKPKIGCNCNSETTEANNNQGNEEGQDKEAGPTGPDRGGGDRRDPGEGQPGLGNGWGNGGSKAKGDSGGDGGGVRSGSRGWKDSNRNRYNKGWGAGAGGSRAEGGGNGKKPDSYYYSATPYPDDPDGLYEKWKMGEAFI